MDTEFALSVRGLAKSFHRKVAVDGVSLSVVRGEIVGFLGPNGAGKTTVMSMAMGLIAPDAGEIDLLGVRNGYRRSDVRMRIGFLQEKPRIYPEMTARAYLAFFARLYGIAEADFRVSQVLERVNLEASADRRLGNFSRGMQQRTCLARVMLHKPELLILDEPTLGLDPNGVAEMRTIFREMKAEGVTLLFSSHQLAEMERICDSVIFMREGKVIAAGRQADIVPAHAGDSILAVEVHEAVQPYLAAIQALPGIASVRESGTHRLDLALAADSAADLQANRARISQALTGLGLTVLSVGAAAPSLEDLFIHLTGPGSRQDTRLKEMA